MVRITPRWEWRLFAKQIDLPFDLEAFEKTRHVESSETYFVSAQSTANPKVRDEKMDIKTLERVSDVGLEQWKPEMKAAFPLSRDEVIAVYGALGLSGPDFGLSCYGFEDFLALIDADDRASAVRVEKVRDQYDVDGCTVEMSDVTFDGDNYKTVAAEHASQDLVFKIVGKLGLQTERNTNYVRFIKQLKGLS